METFFADGTDDIHSSMREATGQMRFAAVMLSKEVLMNRFPRFQ